MYTFSVSESEEPGYSLGPLIAQDADKGEASVLEFMLLSESEGQGFSLDRFSGNLKVTEELDRECNQLIQLKALVKNPGPIFGLYSAIRASLVY